jgi:hypothetical protein
MTHTWIRPRVAQWRCGGCDERVGAGEPVMVITGPTWQLFRCARNGCAGEDPPTDLEALPPFPPPILRRRPPVRASLRSSSSTTPALDAKQRQLGGDQ